MSEPVDPRTAQPPEPSPPRISLTQRLGTRALVRPVPRQGVSLAGAGVALVVVGIVAWGGDFLTSGTSDTRQLLGVLLSLAAVIVGYLLAVRWGRGPLGTAGVVASALAVPVLLGFISFDRNSSGLPVSFDLVVLLSVAVWLVTYFTVPGARGHGLYLGLAAVLFWVYVVDKAEPGSFGAGAVFGGFVPVESTGPAGPDFTTVAILSLTFGLGYYALAFGLDRVGRTGLAVPFVVAGPIATISGLTAAAVNLHEVGTGILAIVLGIALGRYGALAGRRFTTWIWSVGVAVGIALIAGKATEDNAAGAGVAFIVCGSALVVLAHLLAVTLREPDDVATMPGPQLGAGPLP